MQEGGFRLERAGPLWIARCEALLDVPDLGHAFSTRRASDDTELDVASSPAGGGHDGEAVVVAAGLGHQRLAFIRQCHGAVVVDATQALGQTVEADAVVTSRDDEPAVAAVRTADCVPLLLVDRAGRAAAVHAGWRGVARGVVRSALDRMAGLGSEPAGLIGAVGPCIGPCCYEVGPDVAEAVRIACETESGPSLVEGGRTMLDLRRAVRIQLEAAGVRRHSIWEAPWCTACAAEWFHSYRRDGMSAGRQWACVGFRARSQSEAP